MDAYIIKTEKTITPFGDVVSASRVRDAPLRETQRRALEEGGADRIASVLEDDLPGEGSERLLLTDDLWITSHLVQLFIKRARSAGEPAILALPEGLLTEFTAALQDLGAAKVEGQRCYLYPLVWLPPGEAAPEVGDLIEAADDFSPVAIDPDPHPIEIPVHKVFSMDRKLELPLTHLAAVRISHWMHILRANQMALLAWGGRLFNVNPLRLLWAAIRAMSINKWRVMQKLTTRGEGCDIHPSAIVEASTLGDNVSVGAGSVVRFSHLADGARIADQCNILYSVVGEDASVSRMGMLQSSILYPRANSGHYGLQLCVIGDETFVGGEVVLGDFKPQGEIMVKHRGELVPTGTNILGCAVGHDCSIMMRATMYAGREVPNGYTIIGPPHDIIAKIPGDLPKDEPLISVDGVLSPYREERDNSDEMNSDETTEE